MQSILKYGCYEIIQPLLGCWCHQMLLISSRNTNLHLIPVKWNSCLLICQSGTWNINIWNTCISSYTWFKKKQNKTPTIPEGENLELETHTRLFVIWASSGETASVSALGSGAVRWMMCGGGAGDTFAHRRVLTGAHKPGAMLAAGTACCSRLHPSRATHLQGLGGGQMLTLAFCHRVDASTICECTVVTER